MEKKHCCIVRGCKIRDQSVSVSLFRIPVKDTERAKLWLQVCSREDLLSKSDEKLKNYKLCAIHFNQNMFVNPLRNRLLACAVPTIFPWTRLDDLQDKIDEVAAITSCVTPDPLSSPTSEEANVPSSSTNNVTPAESQNISNNNLIKQDDGNTSSCMSPDPLSSPVSTEADESPSTNIIEPEIINLPVINFVEKHIRAGGKLNKSSANKDKLPSNICIVCLDVKNNPKVLHKLSDKPADRFKNIYDMLKFCVPKLRITTETIASSFICKMCLYELNNCISFIEKCIKSNQIIRSIEICKKARSDVTGDKSKIQEIYYLDFPRLNQNSGGVSLNLSALSNLTNNKVFPDIDSTTKIMIVDNEANTTPEDEVKEEVQDETEPESVIELDDKHDTKKFVYEILIENAKEEPQAEIESEGVIELDNINERKKFEHEILSSGDSKVELRAETETDGVIVELADEHEAMEYESDISPDDAKEELLAESESDDVMEVQESEPEVEHKLFAKYKVNEPKKRIAKKPIVKCSECNISYLKYKKHKCMFFCTKCDFNVDSKEQLQNHIKDNMDEDECKCACQYCPMMIPSKEFKEHVKTHPTFECVACGKLFQSRSSLSTHIRIHSGRNHKCPQCGLGFKTKTGLRDHIRCKHLKETWRYLCDRCPSRFPTNAKLKIHRRHVHDKIPGGVCTKCGKTFTNQRIADEHDRVVHLKLRPYCCEVCGHLFAGKDNMLKHAVRCRRRLSEGKPAVGYKSEKKKSRPDYPVECVYCNKILSNKRSLITHVKALHLDVPRPFKCSTCNLRFGLKFNLVKHERTHTGSHRCDVCYKKFENVNDLETHMTKTHKKTPYECKDCGEKFARLYLMQNHKYNVHDSQRILENSKEILEKALKHAESAGKMHYYKNRSKRRKRTDTNIVVENRDMAEDGNVVKDDGSLKDEEI